ncbi:cation:proton antiporter [Pseudonocardia abyssalis]|uniref:Cation:proton antiporter n=1 Tax=Pseudonocardia abyssalis TaxID=2792008 RepID=A0ABS6UKA5_9PSEU|nr:cation:proton antiporter [Pseudonocardia abyssalis]MBW0116447.1 cation:proton antiporter [Pseudonocardia abyssalis]MBW0132661.1 cation:proton antiporter [Pseudonocardia abyssalis]
MDLIDLTFALVGIGALAAGLLPRLLAGRPLSMPIVFLGLGMAVFAVVPALPAPDPLAHPEIAEHLTEVVVIIALMGAGLKLDRPIGWRSWSSTWRLLGIGMPLMIVATAVLGWWALGLAPAAALLFGSALAPTDPVLASDVQVGEPGGEEQGEDEVRFALTSEAGLNDALAFPFVYAAIAIATAAADPFGWVGEWVVSDVLVKIAVGVVGGVVVGRGLGLLFFRARSEQLKLASHAEGFIALAATFLAYGLTEVAGGYGFLAVFVCARSIRASERDHEYHQVLHDFVEQIERLLTVLLLVLFGGAVVRGLLGPLTWPMVAVGLALVLVVRPATAWLALGGATGSPQERTAIAVFGIRGIGSFYYLAYATSQAPFAGAEQIWAAVGFVVVLSVTIHGVAATPIMRRLDRGRRAAEVA